MACVSLNWCVLFSALRLSINDNKDGSHEMEMIFKPKEWNSANTVPIWPRTIIIRLHVQVMPGLSAELYVNCVYWAYSLHLVLNIHIKHSSTLHHLLASAHHPRKMKHYNIITFLRSPTPHTINYVFSTLVDLCIDRYF